MNTRYLELPDKVKERISEKEFSTFSTKFQWAIQRECSVAGDYEVYDKLRIDVRRHVTEECFEKMPQYIRNRLRSNESLLEAQIIGMSKLPWERLHSEQEAISVPEAKELLDRTHLGLDFIKDRVLRYIACQKRIGSSYGTVLLFCGPPGVGKTSIVRTIAQAMNRPLVKISLAGVADAAVLKGTSTIYSNSRPGKIVEALIQTKSFAPVILFDEVDKIARRTSAGGDPQYALLDILDSDRSEYIDECLGVPLDLRNVIFIATANEIEDISPILLDRFDVVTLQGYTDDEKFFIAKDYLLRDLYAYYTLSKEDVYIPDDTIRYLVTDGSQEAGVRKLNNALRQIFEEAVYCKEMGVLCEPEWTIDRVKEFFAHI